MDKNSVKRILVMRIDFLGDMLCTTPLLDALKARWPHAELHVLASKYNAPVLGNNPVVSRIYHYVYSKNHERNDQPGFFYYLKERIALLFTLRRMKFDLLIIPSGGMNKNAITFSRQLNISDCRWHGPDSEFDDRVKAHIATRPFIHEALSGFSLVPELQTPAIEQLKLRVYPCQTRVAWWQKFLGEKTKPRAGLFISNKSVDRRWPLQKWQALSEALGESCDVIVFHSPEEAPAAVWPASIKARWLSPENVTDLIAAITQLDIVVSADSAPVHLASALGIPVVAMFESRPEKYLRWHPLGVRYRLLYEGRRVEDIACASVYAAAVSLLEEKSSLQRQALAQPAQWRRAAG